MSQQLFGFIGPIEEPPEEVPQEIMDLYEKFAFEVWRAGYRRYSSDAILHRIRWTMNVERGLRMFKCNDHWTSALSRWFMKKHPEMGGFFELRVLRAGERDDG